ncbi:hypothetical protein AALP_AA7G215600 [Arabis alpina]|uniref:Uncharacterized protein n=1 Tax=Arabis alpina TaxID=50452 RepID=A0A087GJN8_ARAAL|nr:hypothetical protein AALP_AA7G215600 [Arabis alpina]
MVFLPFVKKLGLIFLLLSASTFALSFAGRSSILIYREDDNHQEVVERRIVHEHERILRMNSRDYGHSSPKPKFVRPPFKLIPN